jgi:hypothetical protein
MQSVTVGREVLEEAQNQMGLTCPEQNTAQLLGEKKSERSWQKQLPVR